MRSLHCAANHILIDFGICFVQFHWPPSIPIPFVWCVRVWVLIRCLNINLLRDKWWALTIPSPFFCAIHAHPKDSSPPLSLTHTRSNAPKHNSWIAKYSRELQQISEVNTAASIWNIVNWNRCVYANRPFRNCAFRYWCVPNSCSCKSNMIWWRLATCVYCWHWHVRTHSYRWNH